MSRKAVTRSQKVRKDPERHPLMILAAYVGSLKLAVFLIVILAGLLIGATFFESYQSTELAQRFVYQTVWFDLYLLLFALNVFSAVVTRWPFQKKHVGFILTHAGILIICLGSAMNRHAGIEGQMMLREGDTDSRISLGERVLSLGLPGHRFFEVPAHVPRVRKALNRALPIGETGYAVTFLDAYEAAKRATHTQNSLDSDRNPAVLFELRSEAAGFSDQNWLVYFDEQDPDRHTWSLGPATFRLVKALSEEEESMLLTPAKGKDAPQVPEIVLTFPGEPVPVKVPVDAQGRNPERPVLGDITIANIEYFPQAQVAANRLMNNPDAPPNPAVRFDLKGVGGKSETHTAFANFPDFDSLHGRTATAWSGVRVRLITPSMLIGQSNAEVLIVQTIDGRLRYLGQSGENEPVTGDVTTGTWYSAGWMDFEFRIEEYYPNAVVRSGVEPVSPHAAEREKKEAQAAVRWKVSRMDPRSGVPEESLPVWTLFGETSGAAVGDDTIEAVFTWRHAAVPFSLTLLDFRRDFYPGSSSPKSYESDVRLRDREKGISIEQKIYMNHPLDHRGYRIFQSSYIEVPPGQPEISVFQISKAPGTNVIYWGSTIMVLGIMVMFYIMRFSTSPFWKNGQKKRVAL